MAVATSDVQEVKDKYAVVWKFEKSQSSGLSVFENEAFQEAFYHRLTYNTISQEGTQRDFLDKDFINYEVSLRKQYNALKEYYEGISLDSMKGKMKDSLTELLNFKPDAFSMELSTERNIFYTLIKGSYTVFITHLLDEIEEDEDEIILTIFDGDNNLPNFSGNLENTIAHLEGFIKPERVVLEDSVCLI